MVTVKLLNSYDMMWADRETELGWNEIRKEKCHTRIYKKQPVNCSLGIPHKKVIYY